ncbi:hypothetical protein CCMSSC00406_0001819 [Pleurotus cornucopiae]|uniref:Uncharacterized protein n=1 Tax=Pleurotus cornucopiae TaxID=5321 RepID=A0ACB7J4W2_PLECO|nr:hypothetical protein CCMSSC00406_0001819 [Pleurotus cornucopiae]
MYGYAPKSPHITNNPFVSDPSNAQGRYPDISVPSPPANGQFTSWIQPGQNNYQTPQLQPTYQPQQQPLQQFATGYGSLPGGGSGFLSPIQPQPTSQPFQPSSTFGRQLTAQVNGSSYGYLSGEPTGVPQQQYAPAQQQLSSPTYIAQFDPYSSLGQLENIGRQPQNRPSAVAITSPQPSQSGQNTGSQILSPTTTSPMSIGPNGQLHPREYIRTHKAELEAWDAYAWKQVIGAFEALKDAWEKRKKEVEARAMQLRNQLQIGGGGYYSGDQIQQESSRLQGLYKEADSLFGTVAASTFQMQEAYTGYHQSGDAASKRRVRESVNYALQGLPDWPSQSF